MRIFLILFLLSLFFIADGTKVKSPVLDLNDKFLDVVNDGFWFIKFYAPWCAHCKRLAPTWDHLGHALEDLHSPVRVGKVDCTRFTTVCSAMRVNAYPTIIFFRKGTKIPYEGERKKESMVDFVIKSSGPVVNQIETAAKFSEYKKNSEKDPFFVFVDPVEENEKDKKLFAEFEGVAEQLFTESRFTRTKSISLLPNSVVLSKRPGIIVFKDGTHYIYDDQKYPDLFTWIQAERWPLIPQATPANIHSLGKTEKKIVLIVSDFVDMGNLSTPTGRFFKVAKEAANLVRKDEYLSGKFQFAWLDGNQIANNIAMMEMSIPDLLVFNQSSYEFYLNPDQPNESTPPSIVTFLQTVDEGQIQPLGGRSWTQRIRRMYYDITTNIYDMFRHQPILTVCLFGVPLAFFAIITYSICASDFSVDRDEIYPEDEEDSEDELLREVEKEEEKQELEGPRRRKKQRSSSRGRDGSGSDQSLISESEEEGMSEASSDHEKAD